MTGKLRIWRWYESRQSWSTLRHHPTVCLQLMKERTANPWPTLQLGTSQIRSRVVVTSTMFRLDAPNVTGKYRSLNAKSIKVREILFWNSLRKISVKFIHETALSVCRISLTNSLKQSPSWERKPKVHYCVHESPVGERGASCNTTYTLF